MDINEILSMVRKFNRKREEKEMDIQKYGEGMNLVDLLNDYEASCYPPLSQSEVQAEIRMAIANELHNRVTRALVNIGDCGALGAFNCIMLGRLER